MHFLSAIPNALGLRRSPVGKKEDPFVLSVGLSDNRGEERR